MCCSIFYHLLGYKTIDILLFWQMVNFAMFTRGGFAMGGWKYFEGKKIVSNGLAPDEFLLAFSGKMEG